MGVGPLTAGRAGCDISSRAVLVSRDNGFGSGGGRLFRHLICASDVSQTKLKSDFLISKENGFVKLVQYLCINFCLFYCVW